MPGEPTAQDWFNLRVHFTGICLYAFDSMPGGPTKVAVVMPDARLGGPTTHLDNTPAEPHVGYLRLDLRNFDADIAGVPVGDAEFDPAYEVVHRFVGEEVDFGLDYDGSPLADAMCVPRLEGFAPVLEPLPALVDLNAPKDVLMRARLFGGEVSVAHVDPCAWEFAPDLHPGRQVYRDRFGGEVVWHRRVRGARLLLRIIRFDGGGEVRVPLRATITGSDGPSITLKMGNLCKVNPLEWPQIPERPTAEPDADFKWLYRLLRVRKDASGTPFPPARLPIPVPVKSPRAPVNRIYNCFGLRATAEF